MDARGKECTWVQCQNCGHIYQVANKTSIGRSMIKSVCPKCDYDVGLNCGDDIEDIYYFINPNLDERYFIY